MNDTDAARGIAHEGHCYVRGSTEVQEGVTPTCDEPGCGKPIEDFWNALYNAYPDEDGEISAEAEYGRDTERDYDPDEDRTP